MLTTTLSEILNEVQDPGKCANGNKKSLDKLLCYLSKTEPDDEELPLLSVLEADMDLAMISLRLFPEHNKEWRLFAVWCAEQVSLLMVDSIKASILFSLGYLPVFNFWLANIPKRIDTPVKI